ncbi:phosphatidylinositol-4- kinase [Coemansia guatemalensis]|uniref:1-phosphatidylinositol 4-kinase n=1 Tax=Coemansia guatemalensis TaxID=2761395 RepID=A0A9W8LT18_9FUNG|nr:phosphatidylinositol-4- kinase [Coemansia guatemalensis]
MEGLELHSLILEELSQILSFTCEATSKDRSVLDDDPAVRKIVAQCPPLPSNSDGGEQHTVNKRQENAMLALANIACETSSETVRKWVLERVLAYLEALPRYRYQNSALGVLGVPTEHWFVERLVGRLLQCAAQRPADSAVIIEGVWAHVGRMVDVLESAEPERAAAFGLPALLGTLEALEKTQFRFRALDVLQADTVLGRLLARGTADRVHAAVGGTQMGAAARRTVAQYQRAGVGVSANQVVARFLVVVRAVLESRLAVQLVARGALDAAAVDRKDAQQLWDVVARLGDDAEGANAWLDGGTDGPGRSSQDTAEQHAYSRILAVSLQTYSETRAMALEDVASDLGQPTATTGESIMGRCLYTGALAALLRGRTDPRLMAELVAHVRSEHVLRLARLTVVAFRVLAVLTAFFPDSRETASSAVARFVTDPPRALVEGLPLDGEAGALELTLLSAAAAALGGRQRAESAAHTLFNALAVQRMGGAADERMVRVSRSVIVVLSQLALRLADADVTALVVGMVCAPRFVASAQLAPLVVQRVAAVAPVATPVVFGDIVAAILKRIVFGDGADDSLNTAAGNALTRLAARVGDRRDLVEGFFCAVLRFFVDASIASPAPQRFRRHVVTPMAVLLPVLHALVRTRAYALDREADAEQISLWRNFWLHMVARGYLLDKSYVAAYGRVYAALAARSPILVHPSSINYLVTEIEYSSVLQRESSDASLARLRRALAPLSSTQSLPLLRSVSFAQAAFLLATYSVELARASAGNCATVLAYFGNSAVATSPLLPAIESIATLVISAYVRETTSRKWSVEASLASAPHADSHAESSHAMFREPTIADQKPLIVIHEPTAVDQELYTTDQEMSVADQDPSAVSHEPPAVVAQVRELMVASCHHLQLVSSWAQRFVDRIMRAFPQALLDPSAVRMLLELVQLVWKSCKAEQDDQFVPVYWFTSRTLNLTLQFPDSISYRKALFTSFSACAKRWLEMAAAAAPMELEALLQVYLSSPSDEDLNYEPHIGHSLALDVANSIRYSSGPPVEVGSSAIVLPPNSSSFIYRLGQRDFLRGCIGRGTDATALKSLLSDIYVAAKERPGEPLPEDFPSTREISESMTHAAHYIIATAHIDRELARLLVWVPLTLLDDSLMRATGHMWTMLIVERPDVEVLIMVELTIAWTWLIQQHLGLFSHRFEPRSPFAAKMSYTPSDKSARARAYAVISRTLAPHMLLIEFLAQRFDSVKHLPYSNFAVISAILRILQVTFDNADRISSNALARGPLFMLVHLGFKLLKLGFESSPILEAKLRDGLYDLAFRWFALPPCWSFSGSKATLAKEIHILIDTRHTVKSDSPVLCSVPSQVGKWSPATQSISPGSSSSVVAQSGGGSVRNTTGAGNNGAPQPLTQLNEPTHERHHHLLPHPHLRHLNPLSRHWRHSSSRPYSHLASAQYSNTTSASSLEDENSSAAAEHDLILDMPREQLKQRALRNRSLLLVLIENEICRMATWANPTDQHISYFPDVARFARNAEMTDAGWQNLVVDAWAANPRLAVQLIQRFSHPAVRRELKSLICKFPGELVQEPEALPLLIEKLNAGSGSSSMAYVRGGAAGANGTISSGGILDAVTSANSAGAGGSAVANGIFNNLSTPLSFRELKFLLYWCAVPPITAMSYLASSHSRHPLALQYSMRSLECFPVDTTFFYIPQMVQALRHDSDGYVERAILSSAQISQHFAHQIIWNMKANVYRDEEGQELDSLKPVLDRIVDIIVEDLSGDDRAYFEMEFRFFGEITGISGKLKPFIKKSKPEKKRKIDEELRKIKVEPGVYLPSNPDGTVVDIDYESGRPLQSHAKAPFMATFVINRRRTAADEVQELLKKSEHTVTPSGRSDPEEAPTSDDSSSEGSADILPDESSSADVSNNATHSPRVRVQDLDAGYLASKLASTKIQTQRTVNSAISDAPDLIGISLHSPQIRSGRPSRDSARTYSLTRDVVGSNNLSSTQTPQIRDNLGAPPLPQDTRASADTQAADKFKSTEEEDYEVMRLSAIFKVGDDCRQDVLALQLIAVFKNIFTSCGLDLYLYPYRVVATAPGRGVIDVIPNSISRDQIGREKVNSLSDYFATKYHGVDSIQYQQARTNFVQSLAAYSVLSYLLQFKDRHNGNIMLDDEGHIVHIDFGFILDIAPGGITFESAPFKLTTEYVQVMGGSVDAQPYRLFCELCIKAYLACRPYAEKIIQVVALMLDSGLPCFKGQSTLDKLRSRFQLDRTERDAAQFMADRISDSHENKRTVMYDQFQKATNGIPY